ncbi:MAG: FMN-binding protein [Acidobacteriota bacterium]
MRARFGAACLALGLLSLAGRADGRVYLTQEEALRRAFPAPGEVERRTLYLDDGQARAAAAAAGVPVEGRVFPYYVGRREGRALGYAYFDTHLVRTLPETVLVLIAPEGRIERIEILSFDEPEDYLPRGRWLRQFAGRQLDADLSLGRGVRPLTGATLSSRAITAAARRILALHRLYVAPAQSEQRRERAPEGGP